jgi:hypothetical protein
MDIQECAFAEGMRHHWETVRSHFFSRNIVGLTDARSVHILDIGSGDCWFSERLLVKLPQGSQIAYSDFNFTEDDPAFLQQEVQPRLKPGSHLFKSVPAHLSLFKSHDSFLGHYRRFMRHQLLNVSAKLFRINQNGYFYNHLALVRTFQRVPTSKTADAESGIGNWVARSEVANLVNCALFIDAFVSRALQTIWIGIPGLTVWTIYGSNQSVASK